MQRRVVCGVLLGAAVMAACGGRGRSGAEATGGGTPTSPLSVAGLLPGSRDAVPTAAAGSAAGGAEDGGAPAEPPPAAPVAAFEDTAALFVELRVYTVLALGFLVVALVFTALGRRWVHRATLPFFAGFGLLTFPFLRFVLLEAYRGMPMWADFWEEATEFIAIAGLAVFLWVFRRQLGLSRSGDSSAGAAAPPPAATAG
jgi:hypothetical protein